MSAQTRSFPAQQDHETPGGSYLTRMGLLFASGFAIGFAGWLLTGYDRLYTMFVYHLEYGTTLAAWSGLATGLLACAGYGLFLGISAPCVSTYPKRHKMARVAKHVIAMSFLVLLAAMAGLITTHSADSRWADYGYGDSAYILELHDSKRSADLFPDEILESDDLEEFAKNHELYEATVIRLPHHWLKSALYGLGMLFLYGLGIAIYLQGIDKGQRKE